MPACVNSTRDYLITMTDQQGGQGHPVFLNAPFPEFITFARIGV